MPELRKYTFDLDFTLPQADREAEDVAMDDAGAMEQEVAVEETASEPPPTFTEEELSMARDMAFEEGRRHGYVEGAEAAGIHAVSALDALSKGFDFLAAQQAEANAQIQKDAVRLAMAVVRRALPAVAAKYAFDEVTHMVEGVVSHILDEPRIIIRVTESLVDPVRERMTEVAHSHGFEGRVVVQADPRVELGDVRVEWTEGGAERDVARLMAEIDEIVERGLAAPPEHLTEQPVEQTAGDPAPTTL